MNFKQFLNENLNVSTAPGLEQYVNQAQLALKTYFNRYKGPELEFASARYAFYLKDIDKGWYEYDKYTFTYEPIEKSRGTPQIAPKDDYRYEINPNWDGKTGRKTYKTPKDAIESIPADPQLGYRGISWEEWQNIRKTGVIKSKGNYNFEGQNNLTLWGTNPSTAEHYASGFAPLPFKASLTKPGVVITVPKSLLKDHKYPGIPNGELGHVGDMPAKNIVNVWMLVVTTIKPGTFDLLVYKNGKVQEGSRSDVSIGYAIRKLH